VTEAVVLTAITGALAGLFHVLSGPDHLAAVAPLAASGRERGWLAGWTWGFGHASGVVVVAGVAVLLRDMLPSLSAISAWSERLVGAALIGIGVWALGQGARIGPAPHLHGTVVHDHLQVRRGPGWIRRLGHAHAAFYLGILHGIAGSSHFFGVLPALALPTRASALIYIAAFGVGTVIAMTAFAAAVGAIGARSRHVGWAQRGMMLTASAVAFSVGAWWLFVGA
jgi:hypothetical protein